MIDNEDIVSDLKRALRVLAKGVVLIACRSVAGERFVMPATAVTPVSMDPASMLICVNRNVSSYPALAEGAAFSISILRHDQRAIAELCTGPANRDSRFSLGDWQHAENGTPFLADALAAILCEQSQRVAFGSHDVIFGIATGVLVNGVQDPLIYADGGYHALPLQAGS